MGIFREFRETGTFTRWIAALSAAAVAAQSISPACHAFALLTPKWWKITI
jgi:hypothetical protein